SLLQPIVADGRRGGDSLLDVARVERSALLRRVAPDAGEAIRLQLLPHRKRVARAIRSVRRLLLDLLHQAELVLHVWTDLVGNHVGAREITRGAEALRELLEEAQIEIDPPVAGAVERPHRRAG